MKDMLNIKADYFIGDTVDMKSATMVKMVEFSPEIKVLYKSDWDDLAPLLNDCGYVIDPLQLHTVGGVCQSGDEYLDALKKDAQGTISLSERRHLAWSVQFCAKRH